MRLFAITIPGLEEVVKCNPVNNQGCASPIPKLGQPFTNLADFVAGLLNIAFYIAIFLAFYWLVWGAFEYIMAQGNKENLAKARARITWAIIGLIIILLSYSIAKFASEIFFPAKGGVPF